MNKQKDLILIVVAAVILLGVNLGVFIASNNGSIAPIENMVLWGAFVVLNVVSILWAISLLGLQPLAISVSYLAGGLMAFLGVKGLGDVSVAEITTAGATYGAFGALAIGNVAVKVRLAFFNKGQVPFVFIIVGLLLVDAGLNSGISNAGGSVILNAVILPFVLAGVLVGFLWSVLNNKFGIARKPSEVLAATQAGKSETANAVSSEKLVIKVPEGAVVAEKAKPVRKEAKPVAKPAAAKAKPAPVAKPIAKPVVAKAEPAPVAAKPVSVSKPVPAPVPEPVVAKAEPVKEKKKEEEFFPLEIDKSEEEKSAFTLPVFDTSRFAPQSTPDANEGDTVVGGAAVSVPHEVEKPKPAVKEQAPVAKAPVAPEPAKESESEEKAEEKADDSWLGGHMDLLNKLK